MPITTSSSAHSTGHTSSHLPHRMHSSWSMYAAIAEQDARGIMKLAVDRAVEKAVEETEQQTKKRTKEDMIARCWNKNMMFDDIAEIANLLVEEVKEIIDKLDK